MSKKFPLKLIEWEDACSGGSSWTSLDEISDEIAPLIMKTVGFEVRRDEGRVMLAMAYDEDNQKVSDFFIIPLGMIRKEKTLR